MLNVEALPVAIIGAGPVGLACAAHLLERGIAVKVYEAGASVASNVRDWGHVQLFSPWEFNIDPACRRLLVSRGWQDPPADAYPTGRELVDGYLAPLAKVPAMASSIETGVRVVAIGRHGIDKVASKGREDRAFTLAVEDQHGNARRDHARYIIDASGTWTSPNALAADGLPLANEDALKGRIVYGIPDVFGRHRASYARRTVAVVGSGHSAANVLLDLDRLADREPGTKPIWVTRGTDLSRVYGGGSADKLEARGDLGTRLRVAVESGRITLVSGFRLTEVRESNGQILMDGETIDGTRTIGPLDQVVAATGQRPDLGLTRELRLDLDPWLESVKALGPLIDPNLHSCGTVYPHGHRELSHPEPGFYTAGIKSYGRAPTFLMVTGYEQVRSIAAALAGDMLAANSVQLVLPETGVCSAAPNAQSSCCGPAPAQSSGCCGADAPVITVADGNGCAAASLQSVAASQSCCGKAA